ncbi:MAG: acetate/propionate family kinase, partial [Kiritimatiellia bacterium]
MKILVFNCGSSSLKYRLLDMPAGREISGGEARHVGPPTAEPAVIAYRSGTVESAVRVKMKDHAEAFGAIMKLLEGSSLSPDAVAHRLVHGGRKFAAPAVIGKKNMGALDATRRLAPLHNPPAIDLIGECGRRYPGLPQVAVFDTAFHAAMPPCAREYTLPRRLTRALGIRKYGFHGTSHEYVAEETAKFIGKPLEKLSAVSCHLGSGGASLCAIVNGRSVDNTMGFSPLQGLVMSTRCGDIDPAIVMNLLAENTGNSAAVERILNSKSGVLGLSGISSDIRDVFAGAYGGAGDVARLQSAAQVYVWRIRKYIGSYLAVVGRTDALIFTDTIGESVPLVRWAACSGLEHFGVRLDNRRNHGVKRLPCDISSKK